MHELLHLLIHEVEHTLSDTYYIFPLLFIIYLLLEHLEHTHKFSSLNKIKLNPFVGALAGLVPQCGLSVLSTVLFLENKITIGTLISIYISTSDEGLLLLISNKGISNDVIGLILIKIILGTITGYIVDCFVSYQHRKKIKHEHKCDNQSLLVEALKRTCVVYGFIFIVDMLLCLSIEYLGEDILSSLLMHNSIIQPVMSGLIGFIPHCASSILLTELYLTSIISFASLSAGLITNAGLGLLTMIQYKLNIRVIILICVIIFISSMLITIPLQWFYLL